MPERGGEALIKPLPLKVSKQSLLRLLSSVDNSLGARYRSGGSAPDGFDCSGLVQYLFKQEFRMILPRTAEEIAAFGPLVPKSELRPGDLLFFSIDGSRIDHVGIFTGNSSFAHASSNGVRIDRMEDRYYDRRYAFASRLITVE